MIEQKKHFDFLDLSKGLGIIFVVMGHTIFPVHEMISLFHMPLFFIISGLTLKKCDKFEGFVLKKIDRIFVPYLFFSILSWLIAKLFGCNGSINDPLWFLQSLFFAIVFSSLIINKVGKNRILLVVLICAFMGWISLNTKPELFPSDKDFMRIIRAIVFVLIGYQLKDFIFKEQTKKMVLLWTLCLSVVWIVLSYLSIFKLGAKGNFFDGNICQYNIFLFYATSIIGSGTIIYFSKYIKSISLINFFGKHSLIIMCVHFPFLQWWNPMISSLSFYENGSLLHKGLIAILSYIVTISFCCVFIPLFKKIAPQFTGFKYLFYNSDK